MSKDTDFLYSLLQNMYFEWMEVLGSIKLEEVKSPLPIIAAAAASRV